MSKMILVAAHQLRGGTKGRDEKVKRWVIEPGEQITAALRKSHGLTDKDIDRLRETGAVIEVSARLAEPGGDADGAALAAANKRADEAEARADALESRVAELEQQLAEATKPAAGAQA